jgi:hypothetical protein
VSKLSVATRSGLAQQNVDDALLRSFIEVFPTLSYDYDNVHGQISVPGLDKPLYVQIVIDSKAPDRFRVKAVERHLSVTGRCRATTTSFATRNTPFDTRTTRSRLACLAGS